MDIKLPHSTVKRMLIGDSELRANGAAVGKFAEKLNAFAEAESARIAKIVKAKGKKTIYEFDVEQNESTESEDDLADEEDSLEDEEDESEDEED